jgi:hypothetical protein
MQAGCLGYWARMQASCLHYGRSIPMNDRLSRKIAVCFALAWNSFQLAGAQEAYAPAVGEPHPNITLPSIETRQAISLSDYRGKKVLLAHFASW